FNNKIKVQKRIAYGYRNFENFKCRIIVKERLFKKTKRKPRLKSLISTLSLNLILIK
ncbi:transposase, partial [Staphylococcus borealis]|uniref:transposase n=1 Tax=Staphylococcus borealis TaxID=2742203 RepID=UPI003342706D